MRVNIFLCHRRNQKAEVQSGSSAYLRSLRSPASRFREGLINYPNPQNRRPSLSRKIIFLLHFFFTTKLFHVSRASWEIGGREGENDWGRKRPIVMANVACSQPLCRNANRSIAGGGRKSWTVYVCGFSPPHRASREKLSFRYLSTAHRGIWLVRLVY